MGSLRLSLSVSQNGFGIRIVFDNQTLIAFHHLKTILTKNRQVNYLSVGRITASCEAFTKNNAYFYLTVLLTDF